MKTTLFFFTIIQIIRLMYFYLQVPSKSNFFQCVSNLTTKNHLSLNYRRLRNKMGKTHFNFMQDTFIYPEEKKLLHAEMSFKGSSTWIIKPFKVKFQAFIKKNCSQYFASLVYQIYCLLMFHIFSLINYCFIHEVYIL